MSTPEEWIRAYVHADNQVQAHTAELQRLRAERKQWADRILEWHRHHPFPENRVVISDGSLHLVRRKRYGHLSFDYLKNVFHKHIKSEEQRAQLLSLIRDNRPVDIDDEIVRR